MQPQSQAQPHLGAGKGPQFTPWSAEVSGSTWSYSWSPAISMRTVVCGLVCIYVVLCLPLCDSKAWQKAACRVWRHHCNAQSLPSKPHMPPCERGSWLCGVGLILHTARPSRSNVHVFVWCSASGRRHAYTLCCNLRCALRHDARCVALCLRCLSLCIRLCTQCVFMRGALSCVRSCICRARGRRMRTEYLNLGSGGEMLMQQERARYVLRDAWPHDHK